MRPNALAAAWVSGRATTNGWLSIPGGVSAEIMARQGFDSVTIDMQHGMIDYQDALAMLQAISATSVVPLVRVPWLEPSIAMKVLDSGALGVIAPMVNSAADAHALVQACRYPPIGYRSVGPTRARFYLDDYLHEANGSVLVIAQIETEEAVANIEDILNVPGLDAVYIGPADLALTLGREAKVDHEDPVVLSAIGTVLEATRRRGIPAGIHCSSAGYARRMTDDGFVMVTLTSDARLLETAAANAVREFRETPSRSAVGHGNGEWEGTP